MDGDHGRNEKMGLKPTGKEHWREVHLRVRKLKEYVFIFGTGDSGETTVHPNLLLGNKKRLHAEVPLL